MKKKLMMVALVLGALTLGSCVDDNETASVTAVREATAKQLKSVAAMNRAEADALKTMANAEVALMQAKAAAEKANAEYNNALAQQKSKQTELLELKKEEQSIENQKLQALLEQELAQLEVTKQQAQSKLAKIEAQMKEAEVDAQTALYNAQKELADAQKELIACEEDLAAAKTEAERQAILAQRQVLQDLADKYATAATNLLTAKQAYNTALSTLVQIENDLVTAQQVKEQAIVDNKNTIAIKQMQIEAYKQYANYTEDLNALKTKKYELQAEKQIRNDAYLAASNVYSSVISDTDASEELTDSLRWSDKFSTFAQFAYYWGGYLDGDTYISTDYTIWTILSDIQSSGTNVNASISFDDKWYSYDAPELSSSYATYFGDSMIITFPTLPDLRGAVEFQIEDREAQLKNSIKSQEESLAETQRWYNGKAIKADYTGVSTDTEACKNLVDSTAYLKGKYEAETEETAKADWRTKYQQVLTLEQNAKSSIESTTQTIEGLQKNLANFLDQWDMLKNYATYQQKLQEAIDKRNEMQVEEYAAKVAAWYDMMEKEVAYQVIDAEITAIDQILNGSYATTGAENLATAIQQLEDEIAALEAANANYSDVESKEEAVAMQKDIIAAKEAVVKALEIVAAQAKADLDAALAETDSAEE